MTDLPAAAITAAAHAINAGLPGGLTLSERAARRAAERALEAAAPHITAAERHRLAGDGTQEALGQLVREVWVEWAGEQPEPRSSWLLGWDYLDDGQRQVDMRIGATVAAVARAAERARACQIAASYLDGSVLREFADEVGGW